MRGSVLGRLRELLALRGCLEETKVSCSALWERASCRQHKTPNKTKLFHCWEYHPTHKKESQGTS